jgi:hypothetical protein
MIVRQALYAGSRYFADAGRLRASVEAWTEDATQRRLPGDVIGLIVPHGSHLECGPIAGHAYKMLLTTPQQFDAVTLLAAQQKLATATLACEAADGYETPLGIVRIDHGLRERLVSRNWHIVEETDEDDLIESQLPFLQLTLGDVPALPLRVSDAGDADAARLAGDASVLGFPVLVANLPAGREKAAQAQLASLCLTRSAWTEKRGLFGRASGAWSADLATLALGGALFRALGANGLHCLAQDGIRSAWVATRS